MPLSVGELLGLLDGLPASVALWDKDVRLRYGNRRSLTRFGRPIDELLGARLSDLVQAHAVELSAQYIEGALAGRPQQVERAMVDPSGQRYNAHQVTHIPNVLNGVVAGYCALAVDITSSIEGYEHARHVREQAALRAEHARIADDIGHHHVVDELTTAIERLDAAVERVSDAVPSLSTAADVIDHAIDELRATVPARMHDDPYPVRLQVAFPQMPAPFQFLGSADPLIGVPWPDDIAGAAGWRVADAEGLLDLVPAEIVVWDDALRNVFANRAALRRFGCTRRSDAVGRDARELLGPELFEAANIAYAEAALRGEPRQFDRTLPHGTGVQHLQLYCAPWGKGIYSFIVDVTPRVEAELALQDARAQLTAARERERIADDLHNLVIQRLFATGLAATAAAPDQLQVQAVLDGIVTALVDLESAVTTLHENVGLLDLLPDLARLVHELTRPLNIAATIENVGSVEYVAPAVGMELLAVADAALSNVVEHSGAQTVVVTIAADAAGVWLRVVDDGRGVGGEAPGKGMKDMTARAFRLGGTCRWRDNVPTGTVLDWRVPTPAVRP